MATLTNDDKILIEALRLDKRKECINSDVTISVTKKWKRSTLCDLIKRTDATRKYR